MKTKKLQQIFGFVLFHCSFLGTLRAQPERYFPDLPGYKTLVCDLHTHTVFSDGLVWPTVRVDEAVRENLDAIALTDHVEYQPHKDDIPINRNRPYALAAEQAGKKNILLIKGAEITKDTPPGHYNALFLFDIDLLDRPQLLDAMENANLQEGFVFWNHHAWKGVEKGRWEAVQTAMLEKKWLHGLEVANGEDYYPLAHQWCLEKNLTMVGNSDIHAPSDFFPYSAQRHRTLTLVFAEERTVGAVQKALFAGRTAVWFSNQLIGRPEYLEPMFHACLTCAVLPVKDEGTLVVKFSNTALIDLELLTEGLAEAPRITVPARSTISVALKADSPKSALVLSCEVSNFLIAPGKGLPVRISLDVPTSAAVSD